MLFLYFIVALLGVSFGSFLNAIVWRLHTHNKITERSKCPHCLKQIAWYDNIPLFSFLLLRSRCRMCKEKISWQYPLVELWMGIVFVFVVWFEWSVVGMVFPIVVLHWFVMWVLSFIFVYDLIYMEVVDSITLGSAVILFFIGGYVVWGGEWFPLLIGACLGGLFFLLQYILSKGRWVGGGDIRIGILMGVILGWKLLLLALWIAYVVGAIISVGLLVSKKKTMKSQVPFGVFLTSATFVVMVWGERILSWYLSFLSF